MIPVFKTLNAQLILSNKIKIIILVLYFKFHCHINKDESFTYKPAAKTPTNCLYTEIRQNKNNNNL